jgi:hypothetical protein
MTVAGPISPPVTLPSILTPAPPPAAASGMVSEVQGGRGITTRETTLNLDMPILLPPRDMPIPLPPPGIAAVGAVTAERVIERVREGDPMRGGLAGEGGEGVEATAGRGGEDGTCPVDPVSGDSFLSYVYIVYWPPTFYHSFVLCHHANL